MPKDIVQKIEELEKKLEEEGSGGVSGAGTAPSGDVSGGTTTGNIATHKQRMDKGGNEGSVFTSVNQKKKKKKKKKDSDKK